MKRKIILIFGKTGTGKTYYAKQIIKEFKRRIIIDTLFEYNEGTIFYNLEDLINYIIDLDLYDKDFSFICRFNNDDEIEGLFKIAEVLTDLCLLLEEAERYISPYTRSSDFLNMVRYGRHYNISLIGIARRVTELHTDFRAMTNEIITFKQTMPSDLKLLESFGIYDTDKLTDFKYNKIEL